MEGQMRMARTYLSGLETVQRVEEEEAGEEGSPEQVLMERTSYWS